MVNVIRKRGVARRARSGANRTKGWFFDLGAHYVDLARRRRWRLLMGELSALILSLLILAIASFPRFIGLHLRDWLKKERPTEFKVRSWGWKRRTDYCLATTCVLASFAMLMPAAPGPALVENAIGFDAVLEPDNLLSLLVQDEVPVFATASSFNPLVVKADTQGLSEPLSAVAIGRLGAPETQFEIEKPKVRPEGQMHVVRAGENLWEICQNYGVKKNDVIAWNGLINPSRLSIGTRLFLPGGKTPQRSEMVVPIKVPRLRITSGYGMRMHPILKRRRFHSGVDFGAPRGTPILAAADGVVVKAGRDRYLGKYVEVKHNAKLTTKYGHSDKILAKVGDRVKAGQTIARVGRTGRSTGYHLHFEVIVNKRHTNPMTHDIAWPGSVGRRTQLTRR